MIQTARLILRLPEPRDRALLHAMWADPAVMADLGPVKSAAESDATIAKHDSYRPHGLGFWVVEQREGAPCIGFCGLKGGAEDTPIDGELEIGWMLATAYWGQGYAFEAAAASLAWGWANTSAPRIVAITAARNAKSQRLMVKLGMKHRDGADFDHHRFAIDDPLQRTVVYDISRPLI